MITRKTLLVANWKMNMTVGQSSVLVANLHKTIAGRRDIEVVLAPSFLALQPLSLQIDRRRFRLAAQNAFHKDAGGFTGEVSFSMLQDLVHYVIIGHSERRIFFSETNEMIRDKVAACIRNGLRPILCIGETSAERSEGHAKQVVHDQIITALSNVTSEDLHSIVIAYEPVWAITTFGGEIAKPGDMKGMIDYIRSQIRDLYGDVAARSVRILYGGSVDEHNARSYLEIEGCDGALVGSASLNYHKFSGIVEAAYRHNRREK